MHLERYELVAGPMLATYMFTSEGPRGKIQKFIQFQKIEEPEIYNLAFGDLNPVSGEIDDLVVTDNGDAIKVLATVIEAVYQFFDERPKAMLYVTGSTPARTRLYRMGITRFYEQAKSDFILYGRIGNGFYLFEKEQNYDGFVARRKST